MIQFCFKVLGFVLCFFYYFYRIVFWFILCILSFYWICWVIRVQRYRCGCCFQDWLSILFWVFYGWEFCSLFREWLQLFQGWLCCSLDVRCSNLNFIWEVLFLCFRLRRVLGSLLGSQFLNLYVYVFVRQLGQCFLQGITLVYYTDDIRLIGFSELEWYVGYVRVVYRCVTSRGQVLIVVFFLVLRWFKFLGLLFLVISNFIFLFRVLYKFCYFCIFYDVM